MLKSLSKLSFFLAVVLFSSCASSGLFNTTNLTNVELSAPNYRIVATNVVGEAQAGYLIGASVPIRGEMQSVALFRISGNGMLYQEAINNLWSNFEAQHDAVAGRKLALVNIRYDSEAVNVLLYTRPKVSIRADVVEFLD